MTDDRSLSPFVYWGQNNTHIFLKIDLKEVEEPDVNLDDDRIDFRAIGIGSRGRNEYSFSIEFYFEVDSAKSQFKVTDRFIEIDIEKQTKKEQWPRLSHSNQKPAWLKIDFDRFAFDESEPSTDEDYKTHEDAMLKKLETEFGQDVPDVNVDFKTVYLMFFNLFQWVGYSYVFLALILHYVRFGEVSRKKAFETVGHQLMVVQAAALLEIVHPLFGWVKTGVLMPLIQVLGRNMVLFMLIVPEPAMHDREPIWWLFVTWTSVELVRYPFYMLNIIKVEVSMVTWLRYTVWIPLYPLGFMLEGFAMLLALPYVEKTGRWSMTLPNDYNFAFDFPTFLKIYMCAFLIGGYFLMQRMYEQRKKKFPPAPRKPKAKAKSKTS